MNTENNTSLSVVDQAKLLMNQMFTQLDQTTAHMPIEVLLNELQLVVERLSFHDLTRKDKGPLSIEDLATILQQDVSPGVKAFVEWAAAHNILRLFINNNGQFFLSYCTLHYKQVQEVILTTPIALRPEYQSGLTQRLRTVHPLPTRIIFRVAPSLSVGCVISTPYNSYDYSLKSTMLDNIMRYTRRQFLSMGGIRG